MLMSKLILLKDIYDLRSRKQAELDFYHKELEKLQVKMQSVRLEMDLTERIIDMIERESLVDIKKLAEG